MLVFHLQLFSTELEVAIVQIIFRDELSRSLQIENISTVQAAGCHKTLAPSGCQLLRELEQEPQRQVRFVASSDMAVNQSSGHLQHTFGHGGKHSVGGFHLPSIERNRGRAARKTPVCQFTGLGHPILLE